MSRRAYSETNFHITWHTKGNLPLINAALESKLYDFLRNKLRETPEVFVHAIGGIENHVHVAVSVPPTVQPAEWIGQLKGASAYFINKDSPHKLLEWQNGYGIVSFGTKDTKWVVKYIQNQKEHHKTGRIYKRLESVEKQDG